MKGLARLFHLFGAIAMIVGLFMPLTDAGQVFAAPDQPRFGTTMQAQEMSTTAFTQVAAVGDFQGQFGCNGFDMNCPATQLTDHNGIWTGTFAIPPGQWQWQIVAMTQDGQQLVLAEDGRDTTGTLQLAEGDAGTYFEFDAARQEATAAAVPAVAQLTTDTGTYALAPDNGNYTAILQPSPAGQINAELQLNGAPVGNPQVIPTGQGPVEVTIDPAGNIVDTEDLGYATLTITRVDGATGEPLPGGCYEVRQGSTVINRGCDADDGMADGSLRLTFPSGLEAGTYTVHEVWAPEGAEQAPEQTVDLQQTDNTVEISTGEPAAEPTEDTGGIEPIPGEIETPDEPEATETPDEPEVTEIPTETTVDEVPGELYVTLNDETGAPIGGACFQLIRDGEVAYESCDITDTFPFNGNTGFTGVTPGTYTLHQSGVPEGTEAAPDQEVTVPSGDEENVTVQAAATEAPTGDIVVLRQDTAGEPVGGACYEVVDESGSVVQSACDEDGDLPDDGRTGLFDIPEGTYTLRESRTPEGYEPAADQQIQVTGGQATDVPVQSGLIPTEAPTATEEPTAEPTATEVPTEEATAVPTETPEEVAQPGSLIVTLQDQAGAPVGGACFQLLRDGEVAYESCDINDDFPNNGNTGFFGVDSGTYTLHQSTAAEGTQPIADQEVTVPANDQDTVIVQAPAAEATAEPTATVAPTEAPVEEPTEAPTEAPPVETGGRVVVDLAGIDAAPGTVCVELNTSGGIGMIDPPSACNDESAGQVVLDDVPQGEYTAFVTQGPAEIAEETQAVSVNEGETANIEFQVQAEMAVLPVIAVNADNEPLPGACWTLTNDADSTVLGPLCDDGANGGTEGDGQVQFEGMTPGAWTLTQTQAPTGYTQADPVSVNVVEGQNEAFRVTHQPATQSIEITTVNEGSEPVPGACYSIEGVDPVCDGDDANGITILENVSPGDYTITMTQAPDGYQVAADEPVTVTAGAPAQVTITVSPATGSVQVTTVDAAGAPLAGACYTLDDGELVCDGEDANGITVFQGIAPGEHTVALATAPDGYQGEGVEPQPVTVVAGEAATLTFTLAPVTGSITVNIQAGGSPLAGGCVTVDEGEQVCDDDQDGVITVDNLSLGDHSVSLSQVPAGYQGADPAPATVTADAPGQVTFGLVALTGEVQVTTINEAQEPLPNACYAVDGAPAVCDDDADGVVMIDDVTPGERSLSLEEPPAGYEGAEPVTVDVTVDTPAEETFQLQAETGTIQITTLDEDNQPLAGACYRTDTGQEACDGDDANGITTIENVPVGERTVELTIIPEGYQGTAAQVVEVTSEASAGLTVQLSPVLGTIFVSVVNDAGEPVPDVCFTLDGGNQRCDNDELDADDDTVGTIRIDGVALGEHTVTLQSVPDEYALPAEGETVVVIETEPANIQFQLEDAAPATGTMDVRVQFDSEELIPETCVVLTNSADSSQLGPFCDGGEDDTNAQAGIIGIADVPVGTYNVSLAPDTEIEGGDVANADSPSVEVTADAAALGIITVPSVPTTGSVRILTTDGSVNIAGACFDLVQDATTISVCDNDGANDNDGTNGVVEVIGLAPGTWSLTMSKAPAGYEAAAATEFTITAGETSNVEMTVTAIPQPGSLTVNKVDSDGERLGGSCFALRQGGTTIQSICDETDPTPNDGQMIFSDLDAGTYQLVETRVPGSQFQAADPQTVTITPGDDQVIEVTNVERPGRLSVITVQEDDRSQRLQNACYRLEGEQVFGPFCDADDGNVDGRVSFVNVPAGDYTLVQTVAPAGFDVAENRGVTITAGSSLQITVANAATPPPAETGTLVVIPLDENGAEVAGGCYQVLRGDTPVTGRVCDNDDDIEKRIIFNDLPVGTYTVRELLAPSPAFQIAPDMEVEIRLDERTDLRVPHELKSGRVLVQVVNSLGQPLSGACFDLANDGQDPACSGSSGEVLFSDLAPGADTLTQTQAPRGYRPLEETRDVTVTPGQTTVLRVVLETAPPPDSGSVQVQKFVCPAGEDGERTQFLGGAQGNAELAKTAGCVPGEASFTLEAEDGSGDGPIEFQTNAEGRYQVTVTEGIYVLTETDPDLPGSSAARLRVGIGQMTTVIVINHIAPPEPEPATVNVASWTCPPSFNGTSYSDFLASCTSDTARTNNLTVRLDGETTHKRVTGDLGTVGTTTFSDIPAGSYKIYGEKPYTMPIMYVFCGADPNFPADQKAINGSLALDLANGEVATCHFFQVPERLSDNTGAILVHKFDCPIDNPAKGYDWENECSRSETQVTFSLDIYNQEMSEFEPLVDVQANPDGLVRFPDLRPGTYKLDEIDAKWCFAQSNSVNADGNVVVQGGKLSEVWVYNCVGTKQPPNTGSGDAAGMLAPVDGGAASMTMLLNLAWPVVALAAWFGWRARRPHAAPMVVRRHGDRAA